MLSESIAKLMLSETIAYEMLSESIAKLMLSETIALRILDTFFDTFQTFANCQATALEIIAYLYCHYTKVSNNCVRLKLKQKMTNKLLARNFVY